MERAKRQKVTVAQIAAAAGVSAATVSRVINDRTDLVTESTALHVRQVMKELGYVLPEKQRTVSPQRPVIICSMPDSNLFYNKIEEGILASANAHGCHVLFSQSPLDHGSIDVFLSLLRRVNAAGVIILNTVSEKILLQIDSLVPVVQCSEYNPNVSLPYISVDDYRAAKDATSYLISRGRGKIAFLNGPSSYKYARERKRGFLDAMKEASLTVPASWLIDLPEINYEMAYAAICQRLSSDPKPNAFFAVSDTLAAAVIKAANHFHFQVPDDIMVVGFDNTSISYICSPSITTVSQPAFQEGFTSCEMLLRRIGSPEQDVRSILLETELIVRETA